MNAHPPSFPPQLQTVDWSQIAWQPVRQGIDRKAFGSEHVTLALHRLMPGHEPRPHSHAQEQVVYILSGQIDFHVADAVVRLGPGGVLLVPPHVMHHGVVVGDEPVLNLDVFTPARPDYLT